MDAKKKELARLYVAERGRLQRIASRRIGPAVAPDIVQDVFAALLAKAREHVTLTPSYLAKATRYVAISHFRAETRRKAFFDRITEEQYAPPVVGPDEIAAAREELRCLELVLAQLPLRTRQVFMLNRFHQCTYDEIAHGLGVSYSTVEREIAKAIMACRAARQGRPAPSAKQNACD
ncbi:RNA polymerase sigma factor [Ensifer adhaerens]|uniref:RNA polymerase sigma factor n=1 Tax=Ensifer adhaerens TaxID=106592 RepID=UPI000CF0DBE7|nr:RNA polymerase sigma factor [Ensifer adhaerens]